MLGGCIEKSMVHMVRVSFQAKGDLKVLNAGYVPY